MAEKEKALEKLDDAYGKASEASKAIIDFLRVWVENDADAAEKITGAKKDPGGAYKALADYARKNSKECLDGTQKTVWVQIMVYYGEPEESADQKLEHGLMYTFLHTLAEKWKPYGKEAGENPSTASRSPSPSRGGKGFEMSLADLGL